MLQLEKIHSVRKEEAKGGGGNGASAQRGRPIFRTNFVMSPSVFARPVGSGTHN